jgi:hypothetical protein
VRQRHVILSLWLIVFFYVAIIALAIFISLNTRRNSPPFVDPVIWRVPFTDGGPQLQPDI